MKKTPPPITTMTIKRKALQPSYHENESFVQTTFATEHILTQYILVVIVVIIVVVVIVICSGKHVIVMHLMDLRCIYKSIIVNSFLLKHLT